MTGWAKQKGFTIVELLIVIVVIGILAAIVIVAYNGVQSRAKDAKRQTDIAAITKALEIYYLDNSRYPSGSGSTTINSGWSTTADASWSNLLTSLAPYLGSASPADPTSTPGVSQLTGNGYNYAYFSNNAAGVSYCGASQNQMYILVYRYEAAPAVNTYNGACTTSPVLGPYANGTASNYRVVK